LYFCNPPKQLPCIFVIPLNNCLVLGSLPPYVPPRSTLHDHFYFDAVEGRVAQLELQELGLTTSYERVCVRVKHLYNVCFEHVCGGCTFIWCVFWARTWGCVPLIPWCAWYSNCVCMYVCVLPSLVITSHRRNVGRGLNIVFDAKQCTAFINHIVIGMQNNALPSSTTL